MAAKRKTMHIVHGAEQCQWYLTGTDSPLHVIADVTPEAADLVAAHVADSSEVMYACSFACVCTRSVFL